MNGTTTVFVTDAGNREVLEYDGASGAILRWYAYGLGSNDVLSQMNVGAATRATPVPDNLGSVIGSQDLSSGALSKIGYLPYGKSAGAGPFGYTGQRVDPETNGLYYYRARHYSPAWGRFLQADPTGTGGGSHLYAYVGNDPSTSSIRLDCQRIVRRLHGLQQSHCRVLARQETFSWRGNWCRSGHRSGRKRYPIGDNNFDRRSKRKTKFNM